MLIVQTRPVDLKNLPSDGFYFRCPSPARSESEELSDLILAGSGSAWSYVERPGFSEPAQNEIDPTLAKAGAAWYLIGAHAQIDDPVQRRGTGLIAFASFGFDSATSPVLVVPSYVFGQDSKGSWLTVAYQAERPRNRVADELCESAMAWAENFRVEKPDVALKVRRVAEEKAETRYRENVAAAAARVRAGRIQKIVMARSQRFEWEPVSGWVSGGGLKTSRGTAGEELGVASRAAAMVENLTRRFPSCWIFSVNSLVGASPEMLMESTRGQAHSRVLAGTASPCEEINLKESPKNLHEHEVAVRSIVEPLRGVGTQLEVEGPYLLELPNLKHLATEIRFSVPAGKTLLFLAAQIHPSAAVGGLPRREAARFIQQSESVSRGRYAGPVGWVDANGGGQLALALRCAQLDESGLTAWAGAGIMGDSNPQTEYQETEAKFAPILEGLSIVPGDERILG